MRRFALWLVPFVFGLLLADRALAALEINEVMSNEPAGETTLEWIELYNNSASPTVLDFYQLRIGQTQIALSGTIQSNAYMIVCRRLFGSGATPGFESTWGNNSGVWGDDPRENYSRPYEASFSLRNSSDTVDLYRVGLLESRFIWTSSGADGVSWERVDPNLGDIAASKDHNGSTPGFVNSVTPLAFDLTIDTVEATPHDGATDLLITVENVGLNEYSGQSVLVYLYIPANPLDTSYPLGRLEVPTLFPGYKIDLPMTIHPAGAYGFIGLLLSDDDRTRNNQTEKIVPGVEFPPVRLSEILANPALPLTSEWVELANPRSLDWDLDGWQLCDESGCHEITPSTLLIPQDSYLVVTADSFAFRFYYPSAPGLVVQPSSWPSLNNDSDLVRLIDPFGYVADSFAYGSTFSGNLTWGREFAADGAGNWGRSVKAGGTPGTRNDVEFAPMADHMTMQIAPRLFSPDGDGFEDFAEISVQATPAPGYSLKIYDRQGRLVRVLFENQQFIRDRYEWDGRSDAGNRLPVGIYICYFEATGVESIKQTVVIAR